MAVRDPPGGAQGLLHRFDRGRAAHHGRLRRTGEARHPRARRQERQHRLRRRRRRAGGRPGPLRGLRQRRTGLLRPVADPGAADGLRPLHGAAGAGGGRGAGRGPDRGGQRDGAAHLRGPPGRGGRLRSRGRPGGLPGDARPTAPATGTRPPCWPRSSRGHRAATEEIFGPVVVVIPFEDEADAVRIANDTEFGLSGSIWTRDVGRALRVARAVETGNLSVNSHSSVRYSTPFGGFKQSGIGRELGPDAARRVHRREERLHRHRGGPMTIPVTAAVPADPPVPTPVRCRRLEDKVAVITGAAGGIGRAMAERFVAEGATSGAGRPGRGRRAAGGRRGGRVVRAHRRHRSRRRASRSTRRRSSTSAAIDICCNNAGISPPDDDSILDDRARRLAPGAGGQPHLGLPVLQVRHPPPAGAGRRLGDQHGLLRRRAWARPPARSPTPPPRAGCCRCPASSASSSPARGCGSTPCARGRSTRRCCASCSPRTPSGPPAGWSTSRWAASARPHEIAAAAAFLASDDASFMTAATFLVDGGIHAAYVTP